MESDFKDLKKNLENMVSSAFPASDNRTIDEIQEKSISRVNDDDSDDDDNEWKSIMREEVKKMFDLVDEDKSGYIDRSELEVLLKQLGKTVSPDDIIKGFQRLDVDMSGLIEFDEFYAWYKSASF
jgi:Ca2+-binding EF-hand superfamily protein